MNAVITTTEQALEILKVGKIKVGIFEVPVSKNSLAYKTAVSAVSQPGIAIVCGANTGSGRYASSNSWQYETIKLMADLRLWNERCQQFNDSPRGGKSGDRIVFNF